MALTPIQKLLQKHKKLPTTTTSTSAKVTTSTPTLASVKPKSMIATESCVGTNISMADLLNRTSSNTSQADKVVDAITKRQEAGLYDVPESLSDLMECDGEEVMQQLRDLDHALIAKTPSIGLLTLRIRKNLEQFPELTHILSDDQLGIICSGVLREANVSTAPKGKAAQSAAASRKVADLGLTTDINDI